MQWKFLIRSLWHYRRLHLGVLAGSLICATVLLGALLAGDSVKGALLRLASLRVGKAEYLITSGDHFVGQSLGETIESQYKLDTAPLLVLRGSASKLGSSIRAPKVQILGVDESFWRFAPEATELDFGGDSGVVAINERLAERLEVGEGDTLLFRLEKPGLLSRDAPMSGTKDNVVGLTSKVVRVVGNNSFGRFGLEASQISPMTLFVPIDWIQLEIGYEGRVNLFLAKSRNESGADFDELRDSFKSIMSYGDYGLSLKNVGLAGSVEIRSERVFIEDPISEAIRNRFPEAQPVLTYLANSLRSNGRDTPYSLVTAVGPEAASFLPPDFGADEIVINRWLADDLGSKVGDSLELDYNTIDSGNQLVEETRAFTVRSIVELEGLAADSTWMPDFPGIADAEDSSDWDAGMPLDLDRIRDKDEDYWDDYRGVPKAFVSIEAGTEMWSNRWGTETALRIPVEALNGIDLGEELATILDPSMVSVQAISFKERALGAAQSPVDIAGLFLAMSFFLIVAALSLMGMLFGFSMQQLNRENALLAAIGIPQKKILGWRLRTSFVLVLLGSLGAIPLAAGYTWLILRFLETIWSSDTTGQLFGLSLNPTVIGVGVFINMFLALAVIYFALRKQAEKSASVRLQQGTEEVARNPEKQKRRALVVGIGFSVMGLVLLAMSFMQLMPAQVGFFMSGLAWLIGGLGLCSDRLRHGNTASDGDLNPKTVGRLNNRRRLTRSLTVVGTLASGVFLVVSVAAFRKSDSGFSNDRKSGYGGFAYWIETSIPLSDPNDVFGEDSVFQTKEGEAVVPFRIGQGDDASCYNLNATVQPRLLAFDSSRLAAADAFEFHSLKDGLDAAKGWDLLKQSSTDSIPAFIDSATLQWAIKKKVGDKLTYTDAQGRDYSVEIIGTINDSIFQGALLVDEKAFLELYPQSEGYRLFLVDGAADGLVAKRNQLDQALSQWGGETTLATDRLKSFHEVENTYLAIFHVLGGLGVVLGSAGLGVVIARNLSERRHEFALLEAIGIPDGVRKMIVYAELKILVGWGMGIGLLAAIVSILPTIGQLGVVGPVRNISILTIGILINVVFWAYLSYRSNRSSVMDLQREFDS